MSVLKFKEPQVEHKNVLTKLELIKLLNTYYLHPDNTLDIMREYLLEYIVRYNKEYLNIKVNKINSYSPYLILSRLIVQGWSIDLGTLNKFEKYLIDLSLKHKNIKETVNISKPIEQKIETYEHYNNIDLYLDNKMFRLNTTYVYPVETQVQKIKSCIEYIDLQIQSIEQDLKEKVIDRSAAKLGITALNSLKEEYLKSKVSSKPKRTINKNSMVKNVKYQIKNIGKCQKSLLPLNVVGKKKMYIYDESKKLLLCYFSMTGFTFTGTTLKDYTDKSVCTKIKDPSILSNSLSELNEILTNSKTVKSVPHGRFNETMIILAVS